MEIHAIFANYKYSLSSILAKFRNFLFFLPRFWDFLIFHPRFRDFSIFIPRFQDLTPYISPLILWVNNNLIQESTETMQQERNKKLGTFILFIHSGRWTNVSSLCYSCTYRDIYMNVALWSFNYISEKLHLQVFIRPWTKRST